MCIRDRLTTRDAVTGLPPANIALTFTLYAALYIALLIAYMGTLTLMCRKAVAIEEITQEEKNKAQRVRFNPVQTN